MSNEFELVGILSTITVLWALGCMAVSLTTAKKPMATRLLKKPMATRARR